RSQNGEALHRPGLRPGLGLPPDIRSPHPYRVHPLTNGIRLSGSGAPSGTRGAPRRLESPIERRLPRASGYALSWYLAAHARTRTGEEASPVPAFFGRSIKALETLRKARLGCAPDGPRGAGTGRAERFHRA